jgi:hypothetical protein
MLAIGVGEDEELPNMQRSKQSAREDTGLFGGIVNRRHEKTDA